MRESPDMTPAQRQAIAETAARPLSNAHLIDVYGVQRADSVATCMEHEAFLAVSLCALATMRQLDMKSRSGSHSRIAGAVISELNIAGPCKTCCGSRHLHAGPICPCCLGSGFAPASTTWRARMCECHYIDFRDRVHLAYRVLLAYVADACWHT